MKFIPLPVADQIALLWFLSFWVGYTWLADYKARRTPSLHNVMDAYRRQWMRRMLERDNRMLDAAILGNLLAGSNFFASTTMLILGGLIALLSAVGKTVDVVSSLPWTIPQTENTVELKVMLLIFIFVYAFFKFTWSMRQFNFVGVMVGSAPAMSDPAAFDAFIDKAARVASLAGEDNNRGLRSYYFGITALTWFLHPFVMMAASATVVMILYHREFMSRTLRAMAETN